MPPIETDDLLARLETALRVPQSAPDAAGDALARALASVHPADIAEALESLERDEALAVFTALDNARAAETLDELEPDLARYLLDHAVPARVADLLGLLPMDDAAEVVAEVAAAEPERAQEILAELAQRNAEDAADVRELLAYAEGTAGRLLTDKFVRLAPKMTVEAAFAAVRQADPEVETLSDLYVVEPAPDGEKLLGVLSLRQLIRARPEQRLADVMATDLVTVDVDTDQEEVARQIAKYDFLALPVLDRRGNLAGIVTVDDILDVLVEEQTEDVLKQSAIAVEPGGRGQGYFSAPLWRVVRSRVGWLVLLFLGGTLTSAILRRYEGDLDRVAALAVFIPLLIGTGGNTGAQSVSTLIRALALGEVRGRDTGRVLLRELAGGLLLGLLLGGIATFWASFGHFGTRLPLVVGLAVVAICVWANLMGALVPLLAKKLRIDPALVSAPLITTLVDATGLLIYLTIARLLLPALN